MKRLDPMERTSMINELVDNINEWNEWDLRDWAKVQMIDNLRVCSDDLLKAEYEAQLLGDVD